VVENQLALHQVRLVRDLSPGVPKVTVDANQMQQVFINLFVNAADAIGPQGGTITVTSSMLSLPPMGITQIKEALCPKRHSLIDPAVRIDGKPALRLKVLGAGKADFVRLDPVYGRRGRHQGLTWESTKGIQFVCPECSASLVAADLACPNCGGAVYSFEVPFKGLVQGCAGKECGWQRWEEVEKSGSKEFV
jgi:hypothetical protein